MATGEAALPPRARFPAIARAVSALREATTRYQEMVVKDPDFASKLETALRFVSYLVPGRIGGSWEVSELAYCVSNLYALLNDYIITRRCPAASSMSKFSGLQQKLLWQLSVLESVEVAVEMSSHLVFNEPGKWGVVILLQLVKMVLRSVLVFSLRTGLLVSPPVTPPDRKKVQALQLQPAVVSEDGQPLAWKAPRTGKVIRSLHTDPSVPYSQLQHYVGPPSPTSTTGDRGGGGGRGQLSDTSGRVRLEGKQLLAEALFIARPLVHIFSMFTFSQKSWRPWLIALGLDLASLQLHGGLLGHRAGVRSEVLRRRVVLLLYLLRSPFYDTYTKELIMQFLKWLALKIPLVHLIIDPVTTYIPVWQDIYGYCWTT